MTANGMIDEMITSGGCCYTHSCKGCLIELECTDGDSDMDTLHKALAWKSTRQEDECVDPKKASSDTKCPMHLLSTVALRACAWVLSLGASKYGPWNWRDGEGVEAMTYVAAIMRHLCQYVDGEDVDEESGESHIAHIMAGCSILLDAEACGQLIDNRPKLPKEEEA